MKISPRTLALIGMALMLSACVTTRRDEPPEDQPLSRAQMNRALSDIRPAQQFGFSVYQGERGVTLSGQGRLHPNHFVSTEMIKEGIPVISMRGNVKRNMLNAMIDPSSPHSWLEYSVSRDFGAYILGVNERPLPYYGNYNTGGVPAFSGVVTQLRIDQLFIEYVPLYIRMSSGSLGPLARGIHDPPVDAIIGYDNLRAFEYIQVDFRNGTINFSATTPFVDNSDSPEFAQIVRIPGQGLAVEGMIDGEFSPILLDFAGDFEFARGDVRVSTTRELLVGDLEFENVSTLLLPVHDGLPRIGRKLMEPYFVTICPRQGRVYFERLPDEEE